MVFQELNAYEEQLRLLKRLKLQGADKSVLHAAALKLRSLKRAGKTARKAQLIRPQPQRQCSSRNGALFYRPYSLKIPKDSEGFSVAFDVAAGETTKAEAIEFFEHYGFVIFRDVIDSSCCEQARVEIWDYLENHVAGFKRSDPDTFHHLSSQTHGLAPEPAIFSEQIFRNRCCSKVLEAFRAVLHDENILVSHDRWCVFRPTRDIRFRHGVQDMKSWETKENLHLDLNPWTFYTGVTSLDQLTYDNLRDFSKEINGVVQATGPHVQGILALNDNRAEDGGTVLVPGFQKCFRQWQKSLGPMSKYLHSIDDSSGRLVWRGKGAGSYIFSKNDQLHKYKQRVTMRAGSLLIWDQRVVHGSAHNNSENFRIAQFIKAFRRIFVGDGRLHHRTNRIKSELRKNGVSFGKEADNMQRAAGLI
jgi:ectoine hydroxylase-related dioxygenase (phytanoyl-CoA dioxygenase family)